jgi:hypothetical protein
MRKLAVVLILSPLCLLAQVNSVSPFTLFGVGDLSEGYFLKNMSMGGVHAAMRDPLFVNVANPASLTSLELTSLDFGATHKILTQTDQNSGVSIQNSSSYFHYLSLGFKLQEWWGMNISLTPYAQVGYNIFVEDEDTDFGRTLYTFEGDGGINQIIFGNGFEVYKNLSLGVNLRYLFGTNRKRTSAEFADPSFYFSRRNEETRVSDVIFDFGLQYEIFLNKDEDGKAANNLVFGGTYGNNSEVAARKSLIDYTYVQNAEGIELPIDTTNNLQNIQGILTMPSKYSFGVSYGGLSQLGTNSWMVIADYSHVSWSQYKGFIGEQDLDDSWRVSLGAAITPRYAFKGKSRRSYLSEVEYRFGGFYEDSHIKVDDQPVIVQGLTAGFNLPFRPKNLPIGDKKLNNFSFGIVYGTKSSAANTLIKEDFINLTFGLTFNDLWFQKRKYR